MIGYQPRHMAASVAAYVALCPDHTCRHSDTFPTTRDAHMWATTVHVCLGRHRVVRADVLPSRCVSEAAA